MSGKRSLSVKCLFLILSGFILLHAFSAHAYAASENQPTIIRVGYFTHEGSSHISPGNREYGYSYDFLQEIAQYYNWDLEFIPGSESESLERLLDGRIDIISHLHYNEAAKDIVLYSTKESGSCRVGLYVPKNREEFSPNDLRPFSGKRIGVFAPSSNLGILKRVLDNSGITAALINFETADMLINALRKGSVEGALISGNNIPTDLKIIKVFPEEPFYFAVAMDNSELLLKIDSAMQSILLTNPSFRNDLYKKHYGDKMAWESILTLKEKEFIERSPVLIVSYDPRWQPFEYYDEKKRQCRASTQRY